MLGNGPGLAKNRIPDGVTTIGCNRSYEVVWSPIHCTIDGDALKAARSRSKAFLYLVKRYVSQPAHNVAYFDPPKWCGNSGSFAVWCAAELGFEKIYLLGFGGDGKFDGMDDVDRTIQRWEQDQMKDWLDERGTEWHDLR